MSKNSLYRFFRASFLTLVIVLTIAGCRKRNNDCPSNTPQYQQLSSSAKDWFPYTGNRILIFENAALKDTLELQNYFLGDGVVWLGDACDSSKGQFLRGNIVDKKSADTIKVEIGYGEQVILKKKEAFILYYDTKSVLILPSTYRRFESTITLNTKMYTQVLVFECSPTDKCIATGITKFYFSKTKGLVAYERNGVLWTLKP